MDIQTVPPAASTAGHQSVDAAALGVPQNNDMLDPQVADGKFEGSADAMLAAVSISVAQRPGVRS